MFYVSAYSFLTNSQSSPTKVCYIRFNVAYVKLYNKWKQIGVGHMVIDLEAIEIYILSEKTCPF